MASAAKIALDPLPAPLRSKHPNCWWIGSRVRRPSLRIFALSCSDKNPLILSSRPGTYWADVFVHRPLAKREIALSYLLHALLISLVYMYPWVGIFTSRSAPEAPTKDTTITYYKLSEYLPAITSAQRAGQGSSVRRAGTGPTAHRLGTEDAGQSRADHR